MQRLRLCHLSATRRDAGHLNLRAEVGARSGVRAVWALSHASSVVLDAEERAAAGWTSYARCGAHEAET